MFRRVRCPSARRIAGRLRSERLSAAGRRFCCQLWKVREENLWDLRRKCAEDLFKFVWEQGKRGLAIVETFLCGCWSFFLLRPLLINLFLAKLVNLFSSSTHRNLPRTLFTTSQFESISWSHRLTFANDSPLLTSYTTITPCVPR